MVRLAARVSGLASGLALAVRPARGAEAPRARPPQAGGRCPWMRAGFPRTTAGRARPGPARRRCALEAVEKVVTSERAERAHRQRRYVGTVYWRISVSPGTIDTITRT